MSNTKEQNKQEPLYLLEKPGRVFVSTQRDQVWHLGDSHRGTEVGAFPRSLDELTVSFYFVLPRLKAEPGLYNLFTLARGLPGTSRRGPRFWSPVRLRRVLGGVYLYGTYEPAKARFSVRMNAGHHSSELMGVVLKQAPPELVCGRLLSFHAEVNEERIFVSIQEYGEDSDLMFADISPSTGGPRSPWGAPPAGHWFGQSGVGVDKDRKSMGFPAGFGLSDLCVSLGSMVQYPANPMPYSGELDSLLRPWPGEGDMEGESPLPPVVGLLNEHVTLLHEHADELLAAAGEIENLTADWSAQ